jgi:hypothetical protein
MDNITKSFNASDFLLKLSELEQDSIGLKGKKVNGSMAITLFLCLKNPPPSYSPEYIQEKLAELHAKMSLAKSGFNVEEKEELILGNRVNLIWQVIAAIYSIIQAIQENPVKLRKLLDILTTFDIGNEKS